MAAIPRLIYGGATIGDGFNTQKSVSDLLTVLAANGVNEIDSAALYPPLDIGASERLLGATAAIEKGFKIDSKVMVYGVEASGTLTPDKIEASVNTSWERIGIQDNQRLNVLHAHAVDNSTPLKDQLAGFDAQYRKGRFDKLGVCNFPRELLQNVFQICESEGYVKPTVYQGRYNLIARQRESLIPFLRENGMSFTAHSVLATGFLSGSLTSGNIAGTRFVMGNITGDYARDKYDKPEFHDAIRALDRVLEPLRIPKVEASLRWIAYHSMLNSNDAMILASTKTNQIADNVESLKRGPLPDAVVLAIDDVWSQIAEQEEIRCRQNFDPLKG